MEENFEMACNADGTYMIVFYVPMCAVKHIAGRGGTKLQTLEIQTKTIIKLPKYKENCRATITGKTENSVKSAHSRVICTMRQARKYGVKPTHFISIAFFTETIASNLETFKDNVLKETAKGVTETMFTRPNKLHLTITSLFLENKHEVEKAKQLMNQFYAEHISVMFPKIKKYTLVMQGLDIWMENDYSKAHVVYGKVYMEDSRENENLQELANKMENAFLKSGLVFEEQQPSALRIVLMSRFLKKYDRGTFDASNIMEKYENFHFGTLEFKKIQLSICQTAKDSFYQAALVLDI